MHAEGAFNTTRTNHTLVCLPDPFTDDEGEAFPDKAVLRRLVGTMHQPHMQPYQIACLGPMMLLTEVRACKYSHPCNPTLARIIRQGASAPAGGGTSPIAVMLGVLGALGSIAAAAGIAHYFGVIRLWPTHAGLHGSEFGSLGSAGDAFGSHGSQSLGGSGACRKQGSCHLSCPELFSNSVIVP